nr:MAG TPA: hypothetical protein [Caudoviricetes sp.]
MMSLSLNFHFRIYSHIRIYIIVVERRNSVVNKHCFNNNNCYGVVNKEP